MQGDGRRCGGVSRRRHHPSGIEREAGVQRSIPTPGSVPIRRLGSSRSVPIAGPIVFGIRDVSETREFESSYTLLEHASWETLKSEILPHALSQVQKLKAAAEQGNYEGLLELLGTSHAQQRIESDEQRRLGFTSREATVVEAVLKVDPTGYLVKHPYINQQLNKLLARWTFKLCTGGGFRMPAFALADDGILALARRSGDCSVGLAAAGLRDHVAFLRPWSGGALSDPNVRRLASLSADSHRGDGR